MPNKLKTQFWGTINPEHFAEDVVSVINDSAVFQTTLTLAHPA